jgi:hypothetical protein
VLAFSTGLPSSAAVGLSGLGWTGMSWAGLVCLCRLDRPGLVLPDLGCPRQD